MDKERFIYLLTRHLANEITYHELEELQEYVNIEKYGQAYDWVSEKWYDEKHISPRAKFNEIHGLRRLVDKIKTHEPDFPIPPYLEVIEKSRSRRPILPVMTMKKAYKIAAGVGMFLLMGFFVYFYIHQYHQYRNTWYESITHPGQKSELILADGTRVMLNANSQIKYPGAFTGDTRDVFLSGEAYFEVSSNAKKPFIVHTKGLSTKVLGTVFNIHAYPDEDVEAVTLLEGKVEVHTVGKDSLLLSPHEEAVFCKSSNMLNRHETEDLLVATGWKDNVMVFDDMSLEEVVKVVNRWYDVQIILAPNLRQCKMNARFQGESVLTVLKVLQYTFDITIEKHDDKMVLSGKGCD